MEEIWKDIKGFDGLYQISNNGRVKGLSFRNKIKDGILKNHIDKDGYLFVMLYRKKNFLLKIHRLVAIYFIPNVENKPCVNHKNGNKTDNRIENLEWCTFSENIKHAFKTGLKKPNSPMLKGEKHPNAKLSYKQVLDIRIKYANGMNTCELATTYKICKRHVNSIINMEYWK